MSSPQLLAALARDPLASLDPEPSGHSPCHSSDAAVRDWQPYSHLMRGCELPQGLQRPHITLPVGVTNQRCNKRKRLSFKALAHPVQQAPSEGGWFEGDIKALAGGPSSRGNSNASSMDILPPHAYSSEAASPPASPPTQHRNGFQLPSPGREPAPHSPHSNDAYFSSGLHSRAVRTGSSHLGDPQPNTLQVSTLGVLLHLVILSRAGQGGAGRMQTAVCLQPCCKAATLRPGFHLSTAGAAARAEPSAVPAAASDSASCCKPGHPAPLAGPAAAAAAATLAPALPERPRRRDLYGGATSPGRLAVASAGRCRGGNQRGAAVQGRCCSCCAAVAGAAVAGAATSRQPPGVKLYLLAHLHYWPDAAC